jgi:hypothetical protein
MVLIPMTINQDLYSALYRYKHEVLMLDLKTLHVALVFLYASCDRDATYTTHGLPHVMEKTPRQGVIALRQAWQACSSWNTG